MAIQREASKTHYLSVDGMQIEFERKRVRNLNLRIRRDGSIHVSAPLRTPEAEVVKLLRGRRPWIEEHLQKVRARSQATKSDWSDGGHVTLWGMPYAVRLDVVDALRAEGVEVTEDECIMRVMPRYAGDDADAVEHREKIADAWMREQVRTAALPLFASYEARMGVHASRLRIRKMKSRWGSCNVKTASITLNSNLAHYPAACLESVVVHELCHLFEKGHNARFYGFMDRYMPHWRAADALLKHPSHT